MSSADFVNGLLERILAVAIGGIAIYFGYRMFLAVPDQQADSSAELSLAKDKRLLISRIAPGTFFALFGTSVLIASFFFGVSSAGYSGFGQRPAAALPHADDTDRLPPRPISADELRQSLAFLSDVEANYTATRPAGERDWLGRRFRAAKLAIMTRGWRDEWGDPVEFEIWLNETPPRTPRPDFERGLSAMEARD